MSDLPDQNVIHAELFHIGDEWGWGTRPSQPWRGLALSTMTPFRSADEALDHLRGTAGQVGCSVQLHGWRFSRLTEEPK